jgi:hypothetical protein
MSDSHFVLLDKKARLFTIGALANLSDAQAKHIPLNDTLLDFGVVRKVISRFVVGNKEEVDSGNSVKALARNGTTKRGLQDSRYNTVEVREAVVLLTAHLCVSSRVKLALVSERNALVNLIDFARFACTSVSVSHNAARIIAHVCEESTAIPLLLEDHVGCVELLARFLSPHFKWPSAQLEAARAMVSISAVAESHHKIVQNGALASLVWHFRTHQQSTRRISGGSKGTGGRGMLMFYITAVLNRMQYQTAAIRIQVIIRSYLSRLRQRL